MGFLFTGQLMTEDANSREAGLHTRHGGAGADLHGVRIPFLAGRVPPPGCNFSQPPEKYDWCRPREELKASQKFGGYCFP